MKPQTELILRTEISPQQLTSMLFDRVKDHIAQDEKIIIPHELEGLTLDWQACAELYRQLTKRPCKTLKTWKEITLRENLPPQQNNRWELAAIWNQFKQP